MPSNFSSDSPSKKNKTNSRPKGKTPKRELINAKLAPPGRKGFLTVRDRKQQLKELPSLKIEHALSSNLGPSVDANAPPPPLPPTTSVEGQVESYVDRGMPIPDSYGMDRIKALVRDPHWIYVYWELRGGNLGRMRFQYGAEIIDQARWVLRVESVHTRAIDNVDVDLRAGQWYVKVASNGRYRVALGFVTPEGQFASVCKSDEVDTPGDVLSPVVDEIWMVARDDLEALLLCSGSSAFISQDPGGKDRYMQNFRTDFPRARAFFSGMYPHASLETDSKNKKK